MVRVTFKDAVELAGREAEPLEGGVQEVAAGRVENAEAPQRLGPMVALTGVVAAGPKRSSWMAWAAAMRESRAR